MTKGPYSRSVPARVTADLAEIWGLWVPDETSAQIWSIKEKLLARYGTGLDIIYDDAQFPIQGKGYTQLYYWNQTVG